MKLSDIKGQRVFDLIAEIIEPIANIAADKEAAQFFKRERLPEGANAEEFVIERIKKSVPKLLKTHKADLIVILAAIEGADPKEYEENLDLVKVLSSTADLLNDPVFLQLFT